MNGISVLDDLHRYNAWANQRVLRLCEGLDDGQLDAPAEIGFGSLRNTLFHILAAEEIWFERWTRVPWRPFPMEAEGLSLDAIAGRLEDVGSRRAAWMEGERGDGWSRVCEFKDSKGIAYRESLGELLTHVFNHGICHRAQALFLLKGHGRTVPGGIDYLFFRFAFPSEEQEAATAAALRARGLDVGIGSSPELEEDAAFFRKWFRYGDWCNARLLDLVEHVADRELDRDFGMGVGSIRKTLLHVADAERWWLRNWTGDPVAYEKSPEHTSIGELRNRWARIASERNALIDNGEPGASRRVLAVIGSLPIRLTIAESMVQLGGHGTHHRAQVTNMLRRCGVACPPSDYTVWRREGTASGTE